jgi:hypothetical protein
MLRSMPQQIPGPRSDEVIDTHRRERSVSRLQELADAIVTAYAGVLCVPVPPASDSARS